MSKPDPSVKSFKLHQGKTSLKLLMVFLLFAAVMAALIIFAGRMVNRDIEDNGENNSRPGVQETFGTITPEDIRQNTTEFVPVEKSKAPEGLPQEMVLYENMSIVESGSLKDTQTGKITQADVVFQSKKGVADNKKFYEEWSRKNNWQLTSSAAADSENLNMVALSFSKEDSRLTIQLEKLMGDTTKVTMQSKTVDSGKEKQNLEEFFKNAR